MTKLEIAMRAIAADPHVENKQLRFVIGDNDTSTMAEARKRMGVSKYAGCSEATINRLTYNNECVKLGIEPVPENGAGQPAEPPKPRKRTRKPSEGSVMIEGRMRGPKTVAAIDAGIRVLLEEPGMKKDPFGEACGSRSNWIYAHCRRRLGITRLFPRGDKEKIRDEAARLLPEGMLSPKVLNEAHAKPANRITVEEAAKLLDISGQSVRRRVHDGTLKAEKDEQGWYGFKYWLDRDEVLALKEVPKAPESPSEPVQAEEAPEPSKDTDEALRAAVELLRECMEREGIDEITVPLEGRCGVRRRVVTYSYEEQELDF